MTRFRFVNGHIVLADRVASAAVIAVERDRITTVMPGGDADETIDLAGGWLMPGFIDTQVNGGGGVLFNDAPSVEGIAAIGEAHRAFGTTGFLPTLITDTPEVMERALDAVDAAIEQGVPGVLGIHLEGPVFDPAHKGIHDPRLFRALDDRLMALLTKPRRGRVMTTLAPERVDPARIAALDDAGVIVSMAHTGASYAEANAAIAAGARGVTHLFNAMTPLHHREPGMVGAALDDQRLWCGLIVDGVHVHPAALRVALRARPAERFMLVTDAMPTVGAAEKRFVLQGRPIHVANGCCYAEDGTIAGSDLDMARAVRTTVSELGVAPERAAAMAATYPAAFLGLEHERGTLAPGRRADWVQLDADLRPVATAIGAAAREPVCG